MAFRIIAGTRGDYGYAHLIERFRAATAASITELASAGAPRLIVPTSGDRRRVLRELARTANGAPLLGGEVLTFDAYVPQLAGVATGQHTTSELEVVLLRRLLSDAAAFADAMRFPGFVRTAHRHVVALRMARVCGDDELARVTAQLPGGAATLWHQLERTFAEQLGARGLVDDAELLHRALTRLTGDDHRIDVAGPVLFGGFDDLAAHQLRLVVALARHTDVTISFPFDPGRIVFGRRQSMVDALVAAGGVLEVTAPDRHVEPPLAQLEAAVFESADAQPVDVGDSAPATPTIAVCECAGPMQEADEVVREVGLLLAAGYAPGDIIVMSAAPTQLRPYLAAAFRRAAIPATIQVVRSALETPAGRAVAAMLDAVCDDDPLRMIAALRSRVSPLNRQTTDQLELAVRRELALNRPHDTAGWWLQLPVMSALPDALRELVRADADHFGDAMRRAVAVFVPRTEGDLRLLEAVLSLIDSLQAITGDVRDITRADIRDALSTFTLDVPDHDDAGSVLVTSIVRGRSLTCRALILHGLDMGSFSVQSDDETDSPLVARELLHAAITRADSVLRFVRQTVNVDGTKLAPHPVWVELAPLLKDVPTRTRTLHDVIAAPANVTFQAEQLPVSLLAAAEHVELDGEPEELRSRRAELTPRPRDARVGDTWQALGTERDHLRVTELEAYVNCSARWLIGERLTVDRDPDENPTIMLRGSVAHAALERLIPPLARGDAELPSEQHVHDVVSHAARSIDRRRVLAASELTRIARIVHRFVHGEIVHGAIYPEQQIGGAPVATADEPALDIPALIVNGVPVTGRIDRIDVLADNTAILHDYKFRSSATAGQKLLDAGELQLLAYWLAMREAGPPTPRPVAAIYRPLLADGQPRGIVDDARAPDLSTPGTDRLSDDAIGEQLDRAERILSDAVSGILDGHAVPLESSSACPRWCTFHAICRIGAEA